MAGLIRSKEENDYQDACLKRIVPELDVRKVAVYDEGWYFYPLASLTPKERTAVKAAGYEYYGRQWSLRRLG